MQAFQFQCITISTSLSNRKLHLAGHAFGGCLWLVRRYPEPALPSPVFAESLVRTACQPDRERGTDTSSYVDQWNARQYIHGNQ